MEAINLYVGTLYLKTSLAHWKVLYKIWILCDALNYSSYKLWVNIPNIYDMRHVDPTYVP